METTPKTNLVRTRCTAVYKHKTTKREVVVMDWTTHSPYDRMSWHVFKYRCAIRLKSEIGKDSIEDYELLDCYWERVS